MNTVFTGANFYGNQRALLPIHDQITMYMNGLTSRRAHDKLRVAGKTPDPFETQSVSPEIAKRLATIQTTPMLYGQYMDALQAEDMTAKKLAYTLHLRRKDVAEQLARFSEAEFIELAGTTDGEFIWRWIG